MATKKKKKKTKAAGPNRTRTNVVLLRLSDREKAMLAAIAEREDVASASEAIRWLIRREHDAATRKGAK